MTHLPTLFRVPSSLWQAGDNRFLLVSSFGGPGQQTTVVACALERETAAQSVSCSIVEVAAMSDDKATQQGLHEAQCETL
jgi:creatinine amidohydrolase/Fe(II)-dependent formamide hydrolase-like protein